MKIDEVRALYEEGLASGTSGEAGAFIPPHLHELRLKYAAEMLSSLKASYSVLDVGCGKGCLTKHIPFVSCYLGIDIVPELIAIAKEENPLFEFSLTQAGDFSGKFGVVVALGVLAHVEPNDLPEFLLRLAQHAQPFILLEAQDPKLYSGKFMAYSVDDLTEAIRPLGFTIWRVHSMDTDTTYRVLFKKVA